MPESLNLDSELRKVVEAARLLTHTRHGSVGVFAGCGQMRDLLTCIAP